MKLSIIKLLFFALGAITAQERSISAGRKNRLFSAGKPKALAFNCPEEFGYYPHPDNCSQYYVCVFGGALKESCNAGLMYSNKLNTCDWPRNVVCNRGHGKSEGVSTVKVTDPRTSSVRNNPIFSVTESLTSSASLNRDLDNTIRNRDPLKTSGSSKSVFDDTSKPRHGRFVFDHIIPKQNTNAAFQGQETASRSFNIIASSPSSKVVFPPILPGFFTNNRFAPATTAAPKPTNQPFVKDLLNNNDTDYSDHYFYYDDILYDEYYDQLVPATTTRSPVRSSSRSKFNNPISINSVTPTTILNSPSTKRRGSGRSSLISSNSLISSPASSTTFSGSTSRGSSRNRGGFTAKDTTKTSSSRGSSRTSPAQTSGGSPQVVGRTPQRLIRPSKKPPPVSAKGLITDIWKYPPRRPHPVRPQPQVDVPAGKCDRNVCQIPDCSCGGVNVPGNIAPQNVPQLVLLTFDDSVNDLNKKLYVDLFEKGRVNPNGCPISATFYVSHEWTDYQQVQNLYSDGHEIASHSISHSFGEQFSTKKWALEIGGQREVMSAYGGIRMEDIRGMRAPFLAIGGNNMFRMLYDLNFTYDSSMPVYENKPPSWPYTLDYRIFHDCMIPPCPTKSYPGVWQVPMVMWIDLNGGRCSMADACTTPPTAEGVYQMLIKNFERHYTTNRAPFGLYYHAAWFTTPHNKEGFIAFLDTISAMDDVWLTTNWQALQWVRNPVPLNQAKSYKPFQCDYPERPPRCTQRKVCNVWHKGSVRYLKTCQRCPDAYPWTGKTGVQSPLNNL